MKKLKYDAVFGRTGHFDNNFDFDGSEGVESIKVHNINPQKNSFPPLITERSCCFRPTERIDLLPKGLDDKVA